MKRHLYISTTFILTVLFSCSDNNSKKNTTIIKDNIHKSLYQFSYSHCGLGTDSVVVTNTDTNSELYNKISIYRDKKLIFETKDTDLEIQGMAYSIFVEHEFSVCKGYYYIFKLFNAPDPDIYLVITTTADKTFILGRTKSTTAEIFGDIDNDGKFEIGGFEYDCESGDTSCHHKDLYNVFEVDSGFPTDKKLTNYFRQFIK